VQDADGLVQVFLVDRELGQVGFGHAVDDLGQRRTHLEGHDLRAGDHELAGAGLAHIKDGFHDVVLAAGQHPALGAGADQDLQLFDRVHELVTPRRPHADQAQQGVARAVQGHDRQVKDVRQPDDRPRHPQSRHFRVLQGDGLGHQLAHHHVQEGDDQEGDRAADGRCGGRLHCPGG